MRFSKLDRRSESVVSHKTTFTPHSNFTVVEPKTVVLGDLSKELETAGNDPAKRLEVLLNHLEQKSITRTEFIEKVNAASEKIQAVEEPETEAKEHIFEVHEEENFEVEIEDEAIAFTA